MLCFHKKHGIVCLTSTKRVSLFCFSNVYNFRVYLFMIIHGCGFNYVGLTSSPTGASKSIRNMSLQCSHSVLRQANVFYTKSISVILFQLYKIGERFGCSTESAVGWYELLFRCSYGLSRSKLTPWKRAFFEKLLVIQLVNKLPAFCVTRSFVTAYSRLLHHVSILNHKPVQTLSAYSTEIHF